MIGRSRRSPRSFLTGLPELWANIVHCHIKRAIFLNCVDKFMLRRNMPAGSAYAASPLAVPVGGAGMRYKERPRISTEPKGELASRTLAMPADSNPKGDIFGGWIMALMDSAGKMSATPHAGGRVVTVSVSNITFLQPVHVGDTVCCYTEVKRFGRTSITLDVEVWVLRQGQGERVKVTEAEFTFVAIDENGRPRELIAPPAKEPRPAAREPRRADRQKRAGLPSAGANPWGVAKLQA
jgi:acyl-CoA thioesterase YciA